MCYVFVSYDTERLGMKPVDQYLEIDRAYQIYNEHIFKTQGEALPECLITMQRKKGAKGYYSPDSFSSRDDESNSIDEIALNPNIFKGRTDKEILSTLVHEMTHVWQQHYGKPSRNGYHNKEWANKMEAVGLMPSSTGEPGGSKTGQRMTHYIIEGGLFDKITDEMLEGNKMKLLWQSRFSNDDSEVAEKKRKSKTKYICLSCGQNAWAKPDSKLGCWECMELMIAED